MSIKELEEDACKFEFEEKQKEKKVRGTQPNQKK